MAASNCPPCHHNTPCVITAAHPSCGCCCKCISSWSSKLGSDHLLQAISRLLLQQETSFNACPCLTKSPNLRPWFSSCPIEKTIRRELPHLNDSRSVFSLLTQRIIRLESLLCRDPAIAARTHESDFRKAAAARIVQSRFRAYLVRRSRVLRQLQQLGNLKASFSSLKSRVSQSSRVDYHFVSIETMEMLLKVQSIQDDHPMIEEMKRLITKEMTRFLDYIDDELSDRLDRIRGFPDDEDENDEISDSKVEIKRD